MSRPSTIEDYKYEDRIIGVLIQLALIVLVIALIVRFWLAIRRGM